jgi:tetratricopeptide (TPR) repeat protein
MFGFGIHMDMLRVAQKYCREIPERGYNTFVMAEYHSENTRQDNSWREHIELTKQLVQLRDLDRAELNCLKALELAESFKPDDRRQGVSIELLSEILFQKKKYALCAPFLIRLLEMYKRCLGPSHLDTGTIIHNIAMLYHDWGKHADADKFYLEAIRVKSQSLGKDHKDVTALTAQYAQLKSDAETAAPSPKIIRKASKLTRTGQFAVLQVPDDEFAV